MYNFCARTCTLMTGNKNRTATPAVYFIWIFLMYITRSKAHIYCLLNAHSNLFRRATVSAATIPHPQPQNHIPYHSPSIPFNSLDRRSPHRDDPTVQKIHSTHGKPWSGFCGMCITADKSIRIVFGNRSNLELAIPLLSFHPCLAHSFFPIHVWPLLLIRFV